MKQKLLLLILSSLLLSSSYANERYFISVEDYVRAEIEGMFEVKSPEQDRVILDCVSFLAGINIYNKNGLEYNHTIDHKQCYELHSFLQQSMDDGLPVCIEVLPKEDGLIISRKTKACQSFVD